MGGDRVVSSQLDAGDDPAGRSGELIRSPRTALGEPPTPGGWEQARAQLAGLVNGGVNIAHEAVHRHRGTPTEKRVALRWIARDGERLDLTYAELADRVASFSAAVGELGVEPGQVVLGLAPRVPELYVAALGAMGAGSVFCPLFSAFGPDPIAQRVALSHGRVLVTTTALYRRKVRAMRDRLPTIEHYLLIGESDQIPDEPGLHDLRALLATTEPRPSVAPTSADDPALLHFTSGTTGAPKGALHVHEAVVAHRETARQALDLGPGDVYWCTADPGWVTGTSYGLIAPLALGATNIVDAGDFDADRWYSIIESERVEVWYTAPTAIRMLMRVGTEAISDHDLSSLRLVASVGEPLNPEAVRWALTHLGLPIHDTWWQSETGAIMVANLPGSDIRPGSMGRPLPGIEAAIIPRDGQGQPLLDEAGRPRIIETGPAQGELALRRGWPSMFRTYLGAPERYRDCFVGDWYRSGDLARRDDDGRLWFLGRGDDVIKTAGHLIGPFEVESALIEHPAVAEAGVIGLPDEVAGNLVTAFVVLNPGHHESPELIRELMGHARARLGPAVAPRRIEITGHLPTTRSGKIMRRLLRARELGLPEGDLSTLDDPGTEG